jgi:hypothetical protein
MRVTRRLLLSSFAASALYLAAIPCGLCQSKAKPDRKPARPRTPEQDRVGQSVCLQAGLKAQGLRRTFGLPALDRGLTNEALVMRSVFGAVPDVYYYSDELSPNAFAAREQLGGHPAPDGTIGLGITLCQSLLRRYSGPSFYSQGDHAIVAVLAHEFAHIFQFKKGLQSNPVNRTELQADFLAGCYMAGRAVDLWRWDVAHMQQAAEQMLSIGDFNFNNPGQHGTARQRLNAYLGGARLAFEQNGQVSLDRALRASERYI